MDLEVKHVSARHVLYVLSKLLHGLQTALNDLFALRSDVVTNGRTTAFDVQLEVSVLIAGETDKLRHILETFFVR